MMIPILPVLPGVNATLNGMSAVFLTAGFVFIKQKKVLFHKICMLSAFSASTLFLISYIYYHVHAGIIRFKGIGFSRLVYFSILTTHTFLAVVTVPLALFTLGYALKGAFDKHRFIAKRTLPIWLYVSITGVVVYLMLF